MDACFPYLSLTKLRLLDTPISTVGTRTDGDGANLVVHFTKKEGAPVRYIGGDDPADAAAVRELDLQKKYYVGATDLAEGLGSHHPKRKHCVCTWTDIDEDLGCHHAFEFGSTCISRFSDNAFSRMRDALDNLNIEEIWQAHRR